MLKRVSRCGWAAALVGTVVGLALIVRRPHAMAAAETAGIACGVVAIAGILCGVVGHNWPSLSLARETDGQLWVTGFGPAVLDGCAV